MSLPEAQFLLGDLTLKLGHVFGAAKRACAFSKAACNKGDHTTPTIFPGACRAVLRVAAGSKGRDLVMLRFFFLTLRPVQFTLIVTTATRLVSTVVDN